MKNCFKLLSIILLFVFVSGQQNNFKIEKLGKADQCIMFIPGLSSSGEVWQEAAKYYSKNYTCYTFTLAGFAGQSEVDTKNNFIEFFTDEIAGFIKNEKIKMPIIVGHSLGGTLALNIAIKYPEIISKVIIVDAVPFFGGISNPSATAESIKPMAENMRKMMSMGPMPEAYLAPMLKSMSKNESKHDLIKKSMLSSIPKVVGQANYELLTLDLREKIAAINTPVLVLAAWAGYASMGATRASVETIYKNQYKMLKNYTLAITDNAFHFIMFDDFNFFTTEIDKFLKN